MARYLKIAADANTQIKKIVTNADSMSDEQLAIELAYLYNLGIRTNPRACQGTVRLNAVQSAIKGFKVSARLEKVVQPNGYSFNKLVLTDTTTNVSKEDGEGEE